MLTGTIEQDLKFYLSNYFSHIDVVFHIQGQELHLDEVFAHNGMLPVLIYHTNKIAKNYLSKHYPHPDFYFAIDFVIDKSSLCEVTPLGRHNCTDMHMYKELLLHVLTMLFQSMKFDYEGKNVYLDSAYDAWYATIKNQEHQCILRENITTKTDIPTDSGVTKEKKSVSGRFLDTEETLEHVYLNDTVEDDLEEELKIIEDMVIKKLEDTE